MSDIAVLMDTLQKCSEVLNTKTDAERIAELEAALRMIEEKSQGAVNYLKDSGEMLFLQYAQGCLDTARNALRKD